MGKFKVKPQRKKVKENEDKVEYVYYETSKFKEFNPKVLGLGNIGADSVRVDAIVAIFDLSGFTHFCNQRDPQLAMPKFLNKFLEWLFSEIRNSMIPREYKKRKRGKLLWTTLPFFAKFSGDGVILLWESKNMSEINKCNLLILLHSICEKYRKNFLPEIKIDVVAPPKALRCGIAIGMVCSVGRREDDYVGPCINYAKRLVDLSSIEFSFSRSGFELEEGMKDRVREKLVIKSVELKGIGEDLVVVFQEDLDKLHGKERALYK